MSKKQAFDPYLPSWEHIPDGEPYVFGDRVYVYGSHDRFGGHVFCYKDYVCWSAPVTDLADWRYEGVIYRKTQDPRNKESLACLYAPDVTVGPDGRYYLFYVLDKEHVVSVAVCDEPAGAYEFLGYVHYPDGTLLGDWEGDEPQFDPGVLTEGDITYLYTGFCAPRDTSRSGAMCTVLGPDMLTIVEEPIFVAPATHLAEGSGFEGHEFFEAPSIRKRNGLYYFIYSSTVMHELCYATSPSPKGPFTFGGVIVSNTDLGIDTYKPADKPMNYGANNHGSIEQIGEDWYIFYQRHTNGHVFSRQGCAEKIRFLEDGSIPQVEITSCGLNGGPLQGSGTYPAYIACHLFTDTDMLYTGGAARNLAWLDARFPKITQDLGDYDPEKHPIEEAAEHTPYIANMTSSATAGFRSFDCLGSHVTGIRTRGYARGFFEVRTSWDGPVLGTIEIPDFTNEWVERTGDVPIPDGVQDLYFTFQGFGGVDVKDFTLG